jgi:solute carrier family 34 (sodium-dependent phosphate cotransporter)
LIFRVPIEKGLPVVIKFPWLERGLHFVALYLFFVALSILGNGLDGLLGGVSDGMIAAMHNPFLALFIGMLAAALIQSSSVTTSVAVVLTAAGAFGPINAESTIALAVPLIMGANVGTTITGLLVALGHITFEIGYRRAVTAAALNNLFKVFTVLVLFPLEVFTGILSKPAFAIAQSVTPQGAIEGTSPFRTFFEPIPNLIDWIGQEVFVVSSGYLFAGSVILGGALLGISSWWMAHQARKLLQHSLFHRLENASKARPLQLMFWGMVFTIGAQSSTATNTFILPQVARGKLNPSATFAFILGANVGTTFTAILASILISGKGLPAGLALALCHLLLNAFGILLIYPIPAVRKIPIAIARWIGKSAMNNRLIGTSYLALTFFLVPFILTLLANNLSQPSRDPRLKAKQETHLNPTQRIPQN